MHGTLRSIGFAVVAGVVTLQGITVACLPDPPTAGIPYEARWVFVDDTIRLEGYYSYGDIESYRWEFGDGEDTEWLEAYYHPDLEAEHQYWSVDYYDVKLWVKDPYNQTDSAEMRVYVVDTWLSPISHTYIAVNDDDDNANGHMDFTEQAMASDDDDLVCFCLDVDAVPPRSDKVRLTVDGYWAYVREAVQVWNDAKRTQIILGPSPSDYQEEWYVTSPVNPHPSDVYVEGRTASGGRPQNDKDPYLYWDYIYDGSNCLTWSDGWRPNARMTVVHVDMDLDGVKDDDYTYPGITEETTPGGFVPLDDFVELTVNEIAPETIVPSVANWDKLTLTVTYDGDGRIRVWNSAKTQEISLGEAISYTQDATLWVEGTYLSSSQRDITLTLTHGATGFQDKIKLTVFDVTLDRCEASFLPKGGTEDNSTTIPARISPSDLTGIIEFQLYDTSAEPGFCLNCPAAVPGTGEDSESWKDLQFADPQMSFVISGSDKDVATTTVPTSLAYVAINSTDYGAYGKVKAKAQIGVVWYAAHATGGTDQFVRIPRDDNSNNIADNWAYDAGSAGDDADTSLNNAHNGDGLTRYEEYRGVDIDGDDKVSASERLDPSHKDLFVSGTGFGGGFQAFSYGNAFGEAGITVHHFHGTVGTNDRSIDVLIVEAYDGTAPGNSGNIGRSGPPDSGVRRWYWATQGQSNVGNASQYGSAIGYTRLYKVAINNRFDQKPYVDNNTWTGAGVWAGPANGILDSIVPEKIEDTDDDGVLAACEQDGSANPPHDDGDAQFDGDYPVKSGVTWEFTHDLSPHDIDNDGSIELPAVAAVNDIVTEYSRAHVVMRTATHEMGHSVGISGPYSGHCSDSTCLMYMVVPNYDRHGHFCDSCRGMIYIHNN
jgi:hypothetical protein